MGGGGEGIGERKKKSRVAFQHDASGGGGDFCGDGEGKGNFASKDIRMKRNTLVKVEQDNPCKSTTDFGKTNSVESGELIFWMEGLKSSEKGQCTNQVRESEVIVDVDCEASEEETLMEDCFGEKNIEDWMKELQVEEHRYSHHL